MELDNKVAIVTGAASGIGLATAEALAKAGARVAMADIASDNGGAAERRLREQGLDVRYFYCDVTDGDSIGQFREAFFEWSPRIDIVANVAGWGKIEPFVKNTPEFWRKIVDLNLMGPVAVTRAFLDPMIEQESGRVIVVASDAGRVGSLGETIYAAAKGGAIAFTKSLAREMARFNITVNSVCPGPTDTPLMDAVPEKFRDAFIRATPLRRLGKPQEVADAVLFFASDRSEYVTGQVLSVSGGLVIPA